MRTARPFVHLKMAVSLDGKVAAVSGDSRWITGEQARARVHELRHRSDAIMIGGRTARADDPLLTDRSGKKRLRPLVRVVIEQYLRISPESKLVQTADAGPVLIFACGDPNPRELSKLQSRGVEVIAQGSALDLASVLEELGKRSIQSVLVEGGPFLAGLSCLAEHHSNHRLCFFGKTAELFPAHDPRGDARGNLLIGVRSSSIVENDRYLPVTLSKQTEQLQIAVMRRLVAALKRRYFVENVSAVSLQGNFGDSAPVFPIAFCNLHVHLRS